jgi:hypothetical protein
MQLLYINVIEQHANWGAEFFVDKALRQLGHQTYCIDYRAHRYRLYPRLCAAPPSDALLLQRGDGFPLPILRALPGPRLFWASELVSRRRDQDRLLRSQLFDHIFFRTPACIATAVARGWVAPQQASILLSGFDPELFRPLPAGEPDIDLLFVGTLTPRRQAILAQLASRYQVTVASAFGEAFVQLVQRAKIVLNIHAEASLDTETRIYEVLGCGAFMLSEQLSQENPFGPQELVQWRDMAELTAKIDHFLAHAFERQAIARRGLAAALAHHTYQHRARQIIDTISACIAQRPATPRQAGWPLHVYGAYEPLLGVGTRLAAPARTLLRRLWAALHSDQQLRPHQ